MKEWTIRTAYRYQQEVTLKHRNFRAFATWFAKRNWRLYYPYVRQVDIIDAIESHCGKIFPLWNQDIAQLSTYLAKCAYRCVQREVHLTKRDRVNIHKQTRNRNQKQDAFDVAMPEETPRYDVIEFIEKTLDNAFIPYDHRQVLKMKYHDRMKFEDIGGTFGVSKQRAEQIHAEALNYIREYLRLPLKNPKKPKHKEPVAMAEPQTNS